MHKLMYFETRLSIVFQTEAILQWASSFNLLKEVSSQFEGFAQRQWCDKRNLHKEGQGCNFHAFIGGMSEVFPCSTGYYPAKITSIF